uniref:Putative lipocalin-3 1 n=1 Tax=Amblyomma triste TaxID=251400 RepID=A0A023GAE4_AMBTT
MNSTERIWTYNTTLKVHYTCQNDMMYNITEDYVIFNRSYYENMTYSEMMNGTFDSKLKGQMIVGPIGGPIQTIETLQYATDNQSCGVFQVQNALGSGNTFYELRFKNKTGTPDMPCLTYFNGLGLPGYLIFFNNCSYIFPPNREINSQEEENVDNGPPRFDFDE